MFATLAGGQQFTTLDLSHAYNQMELDPRFIPNRATLSQALNNLLGKDIPWKWTDECTKAFELTKDAL